jgi:phosphohistidine phosphatase
MKTLLLVRHAKSSWDHADLIDLERPLNERGLQDARVMASRLVKTLLVPDLLLSSPALRARRTAEIFAHAYRRKKKEVQIEPELYQAEPEAFLAVISRLAPGLETVFLFAHNPGITEFANQLTEVQVDDMPTCSYFGIRFPEGPWSSFSSGTKEFLCFDFPKSRLTP